MDWLFGRDELPLIRVYFTHGVVFMADERELIPTVAVYCLPVPNIVLLLLGKAVFTQVHRNSIAL
jgi:hypothetical protein